MAIEDAMGFGNSRSNRILEFHNLGDNQITSAFQHNLKKDVLKNSKSRQKNRDIQYRIQ